METLQHFLYPLVTILVDMAPYILLGFLFAGILHTFITPAMMQRHLSGSGWGPVVKAALFGVPLPLCSCGVLPTAVALRRQGASAGASTSFLIATPQTGVDSIAATYSLLGAPFAVLRPIAALVGAVAGGYAVDRASSGEGEAVVETVAVDAGQRRLSFRERAVSALRFGFVDMVRSVGKWLVIGLVIAAAVTVFLPDDLLVSLNRYPLLAMLAMVVIAIPMYVCATGSIPIALSLMLKGLSPGVAFVLLMAGPAANFASVIILRRSLGTKATAIYISAVTVTAVVFGLIIHYLLPASWFVPASAASASSSACHLDLPVFSTVCAALLVLLLINAAIGSRKGKTSACCNSEHSSSEEHCCCHEHQSRKTHSSCCSHEADAHEKELSCCRHDVPASKVEHSCCHEPRTEDAPSCCCHEKMAEETHSCCSRKKISAAPKIAGRCQ